MPQCTKSAPDHNIDAEFLDSAQDAALPYPLVTGSLPLRTKVCMCITGPMRTVGMSAAAI